MYPGKGSLGSILPGVSAARHDMVRVEYVSEGDILSLDPDLLSFCNVNSPTDLEQAPEPVQQGR